MKLLKLFKRKKPKANPYGTDNSKIVDTGKYPK